MPRQTDPNANNALGELLRRMMLGHEVRSENTQTSLAILAATPTC